MKTRRYLSLAAELVREYDTAGGARRLEPRHVIARRHRTSLKTVQAAIKHLVQTGHLISGGGKELHFVSRDKAQRPTGSDAVGRYYHTLHERITCGLYPMGMPLPKISYLCEQDHVSPNTVVATCGRLERESLLTRSGRRWVVGLRPDSPVQSFYKDASCGVVCIITETFNSWVSLSTDNATFSSFMSVFIRQIEHAQISLQNIFISENANYPFVISGWDEIARHVRSLGGNLRGVVILGGPEMLETADIGLISSWHRPVILMNVYDRPVQKLAALFKKHPQLHIVSRNERLGAIQVCKYLRSYGHKKVGLPLYMPLANHRWHAKWIQHRVDSLRKAAHRQGVKLIITEQNEEFWNTTNYTPLWFSNKVDHPELEQYHALLFDEDRDRQREKMLAATPSLRRMMQGEKVSALIGLNDSLGRDYVMWLHAAGFAVPEDMSVISFDNKPFAASIGLTSVDFSWDLAAYSAAHLLIGDTHVRSVPSRYLTPSPRINDNGSVGHART